MDGEPGAGAGIAEPPRARAKREQIRAAAQDLFLAQGFERTTMDAISAAAHVSKQTLYRYYPSKEQLFADVLQALALDRIWVDMSAQAMEAAVVSRTDLEDALIRIAQSAAIRLTDPTYIALVRVLMAEAQHFPRLAETFWSTVPMRGLAAFSALFTQASARGLINVLHPELAVRLFVGPLLTYLFSNVILAPKEHSAPPPEQVAELVRLFVRAIS